MTADPRLVPNARPLERMTYAEVCEMAHLGAKVVHPRAVEIAMEGRIPLRVRSTFSTGAGTLIGDGQTIGGVEIKSDKVVTGLAGTSRMALVRLVAAGDFNAVGGDLNATGKTVRIFESMARAGISVDMIHVNPAMVDFIVEEDKVDQAAMILKGLELAVETRLDVAKVSVVGAGMRGVPGVMARVARGLSNAGVAILETTDSHANISCLVRAGDMRRAMEALHEEFGLGD
jgi:aspartate kinase